jgi:NADH-quinone oxidoreductase subunit G
MAGANAFGAALTHDPVVSSERILERIEDGSVRALLAVEADLWTGFPDRRRLQQALKRLDHLVVLDYVDNPLNREAGYFIPTQSLYECGGHWINQEGRLQAASAVMAGGEPIAVTGGLDHPPRVFGTRIPGGEPIAAWRALTALSEGDDAWENETADQVLKKALGAFHPAVRPVAAASPARIDLDISAASSMAGSAPPPAEDSVPAGGITLLLVDRTFGTEPLAAMAPVFSRLEDPPAADLHPDTLARLGLNAVGSVGISVNGHRLTVPVQANARMAPEVMVIPRHHLLEWQWLGETRLAVESSRLKAEG